MRFASLRGGTTKQSADFESLIFKFVFGTIIDKANKTTIRNTIKNESI
jgi:hypothetical protein